MPQSTHVVPLQLEHAVCHPPLHGSSAGQDHHAAAVGAGVATRRRAAVALRHLITLIELMADLARSRTRFEST